VDWEEAFDRLTEELDPYHEFLRFGHVMDDVDDPDEWRAEIRRQARRDKIRMHSFASERGPDGRAHVYAGKTHGDRDLRPALALMDVQEEAEERARLNGHRKIRWIRVMRGEEAAGRCADCGGRVYASRKGSRPVIDGDLFAVACPR
jgi:hypothetical protein